MSFLVLWCEVCLVVLLLERSPDRPAGRFWATVISNKLGCRYVTMMLVLILLNWRVGLYYRIESFGLALDPTTRAIGLRDSNLDSVRHDSRDTALACSTPRRIRRHQGAPLRLGQRGGLAELTQLRRPPPEENLPEWLGAARPQELRRSENDAFGEELLRVRCE